TNSHINSTSQALQYFSRASRLSWRQSSLATQFSSIPVAVDRRHLFTVYGSNDIDLALFWNIPKMNRRGHHFIIGINLAVQQNPFQPIDPVDDLTFDADGNIVEGAEAEATETARRALYEQTMRDQAALVQALTMNPHFKDDSPTENLQTVPVFEFLQISSMSASWVIEAVGKSDESEEHRSIAPRQTVFTYYRVRKNDQASASTSRITPERFMAKALEKLVIGQERLKDVPPPLDLQHCHLST
ncbi:hypothetical protein BX616_008149, partial [Lobosporangium transversale]